MKIIVLVTLTAIFSVSAFGMGLFLISKLSRLRYIIGIEVEFGYGLGIHRYDTLIILEHKGKGSVVFIGVIFNLNTHKEFEIFSGGSPVHY